MKERASASRQQVRITRDVVAWYMATHYGSVQDMGMIGTFTSKAAVGEFAVSRSALQASEPGALFQLLVTVAMFQRLRDAIVMQTLRGISKADANELTSMETLLRLADESPCDYARTNAKLKAVCDLTKDADAAATCMANPGASCHLKRHTVLLRRYGHFGKVPTSAALATRELGAADLVQLKDSIVARNKDPHDAAVELEAAICNTWRIGDKISAMFLSLVSAPGMGLAKPPWSDGIDWTRYLVIDRNVDLFLESIGYSGTGTYPARRAFILELAAPIDMQEFRAELPSSHPRLVQQAMFAFMSQSNRKLSPIDCCHFQDAACPVCPKSLALLCPLVLVRREGQSDSR